jgi:hypothetical protein
MAGPRWEARLFMVVIALAIESTKLLTWRMGHAARILACVLIALSVVASFGAALKTVKEARFSSLVSSTRDIKDSRIYQDLIAEKATIDREIEVNLDRLGKLPPEYTTAATKLSGSMVALRERRITIEKELTALEGQALLVYDDQNLFVLIGKALNVEPEVILFVLLLFVSLCIEAGALILTGPDSAAGRIDGSKGIQERDGPQRPISYRGPIGPMDFLEAAREGADLPYLHGRDVTAHMLGISSYRAKVLVRELIIRGDVAVEGKRLKLTEEGRNGAMCSLAGRTQEKG